MADRRKHQEQKQSVSDSRQDKFNHDKTPVLISSAERSGLQFAIRQPSQACPTQILSLQRQIGNQQVLRMVNAESMDQDITNKNREIKPEIAQKIQTARMGGQPLASRVQRSMSTSFKQDFSKVRIHTDDRARKLSHQLKARAFTIGTDIFFGKHAYSPGTPRGEQTLRHELTHVVQQGGRTRSGPLKLGNVNDRAEHEAEQQAARIAPSAAPAQVAREVMVRRTGDLPKTGSQTSIQERKPRRPLPVPPRRTQSGQTNSQSEQSTTTNPESKTTRVSNQTSSHPKSQLQQPPQRVQSLQQNQQQRNGPPDGLSRIDWNILKQFGIANENQWNAIKPVYQNLIKANISSSAIIAMVDAAKGDTWPKDGANQDIQDVPLLEYINLWIKFDKWTSLPDEQRGLIIAFHGDDKKNLTLRLAIAAKNGNWPKSDDTSELYDKQTLQDIDEVYQQNVLLWNGIPSERRSMFLAARSVSVTHAKELARLFQGAWPKDGNDNDLDDYPIWAQIKANDETMTSNEWNALSKADRAEVIADPTKLLDKLRAKSRQNFTKHKDPGKLEKIDKLTGHGAVGIGLDTVGFVGSALSLSKDNETAKGVGLGFGLDANILGGVSKTFGALSGFQSIHRGRKMRKGGRRASRAQRQRGKKLMTKGALKSFSSVLGMAGAGISAGAKIKKISDPDANTDALGATASSLSIAGGLMGSVLGTKSLFGSIRRRKKAKNVAKTTTNDDLKAIAQFTSQKQDVSSRGLGLMGSMIGMGRGISGLVGSLLPKESRMGASVAGTVLSGLGLLTGIGKLATGTKNAKANGTADQHVNKLVALLKQPNPAGKEAAEFAINVLKINVGKQDEVNKILNQHAERLAWINENEDALKALIKSKMDKT